MLEPLIIEFPYIDQYREDGVTCPVCGVKFPIDALLRYNHMQHHGIIGYLSELDELKELGPSNKILASPSSIKTEHPMKSKKKDIPQFE